MKNLDLFENEKEMLTVGAAADTLGVSIATVHNWIKLGLLVSPTGKTKSVTKVAVEELKNKIESGKTEKLQTRANKKFTNKKRTHSELNDADVSHFLEMVDGYSDEYTLDELLVSVAMVLVENERKKNGDGEWVKRINKELKEWRIEFNCEKSICEDLKSTQIPPILDLLGKTYQHLAASSSKAKGGVFYTPRFITKDVVETQQKLDDIVLDPCCGSGVFLLESLIKKIADGEHNPLRNIYGCDLDIRAIRICRVNLLLTANKKFIDELNVTYQDGIEFLAYSDVAKIPNKFDLIATNPPWGANFTIPKVNNISLNEYATDSFAVFLSLSLDRLAKNGRLSFLLPESFADVGTHSPIRKKILSKSTQVKIVKLGKVFKGLMTNVVNLSLINALPKAESLLRLEFDGEKSVISQKKILEEKNSTIIFGLNDDVIKLVEKIFSSQHKCLDSRAQFALGIVTGNNAKMLKDEQSFENEPVLRGKDILPYRVSRPEQYIKFDKKSFQQCADEIFFRAKEKLVYRFITDRFIFAYDDKQTLTLNSANILIPNSSIPIKVVLAILQSKVIHFIFRVKFNSIKVLRKHIEAMPLFIFSDKVNKKLEDLVDKAIRSQGSDVNLIVAKLDDLIYKQIGMTEAEIAVIDNYLELLSELYYDSLLPLEE
jgi:DNA-binding transcriptional MerR regulator